MQFEVMEIYQQLKKTNMRTLTTHDHPPALSIIARLQDCELNHQNSCVTGWAVCHHMNSHPDMPRNHMILTDSPDLFENLLIMSSHEKVSQAPNNQLDLKASHRNKIGPTAQIPSSSSSQATFPKNLNLRFRNAAPQKKYDHRVQTQSCSSFPGEFPKNLNLICPKIEHRKK